MVGVAEGEVVAILASFHSHARQHPHVLGSGLNSTAFASRHVSSFHREIGLFYSLVHDIDPSRPACQSLIIEPSCDQSSVFEKAVRLYYPGRTTMQRSQL